MKKLLSVLFFYFFVSGNAYAEIITFSKCYNERDNNTKFREDLFEKREMIINTDKGIIESVTILTDEYFKKLSEKNSGELKYIFYDKKITTSNKYFVISKKTAGPKSNRITFEEIYDLKTKRIQYLRDYHNMERDDEVFFIQCE